jgi:hypothetical protein
MWFTPTDDWVKRLRRKEQEKIDAERARQERHIAELDRELDVEEATEETAVKADGPVDPVAARLERLERERHDERTLKEALPGSGKGDPFYAPGAQIRRDEKCARRAERQRLREEERGEALGLPALERAWEAAQDMIVEARDRVQREARERCEAECEAAAADAQQELAALGPYPRLADCEAAAA